MVPLRDAGSVLRATVKESVPSPCPVVESPSWIQPLAAVADHSQSRLVVMLRVPVPPPTGNDVGAAVALTAHFAACAEGAVTPWVDELHPTAEAAIADTNKISAKRGISFSVSSLTATRGSHCTATRSVPRPDRSPDPFAAVTVLRLRSRTRRGRSVFRLASGNRVSRQKVRRG